MYYSFLILVSDIVTSAQCSMSSWYQLHTSEISDTETYKCQKQSKHSYSTCGHHFMCGSGGVHAYNYMYQYLYMRDTCNRETKLHAIQCADCLRGCLAPNFGGGEGGAGAP